MSDITTIAGFRTIVRVLLGDDETSNNLYTDTQIDDAVRLVFQLGQSPDGYTLTGDVIAPGLGNGDDLALVAYRAANLRIGGDSGAVSWRTRAMSVNDRGDRKSDLLRQFALAIHEIEKGAGFFAEQRDFVVYMNDLLGAYTEKRLSWNGETIGWV